MTGPEIEFFISEDAPDGLGQREEIGGEPRQKPPRRLEIGTLAAVLLLAAAATLPVVAAFQTVYRVREPGIRLSGLGADGWGRYQQRGLPSGIHETRYGIALVVCAVAFAASGIALATTTVPALSQWAAGIRRVLAAVVAVFASVLGGVLGSMALHIQAVFDTFRTQLGGFGELGERTRRIDTTVGACLWLGLAGLVAALLALAAIQLGQARSAASEVPGKLG
jgi:hypothetical protein